MTAPVHCWWCGRLAEVDTSKDFSGGMIRDSACSWLCDDDPEACAIRARAMTDGDARRNLLHDHSLCSLEGT